MPEEGLTFVWTLQRNSSRNSMKSIPDCSFAYWEVACSADCQTSMAQPVGSTLAISALCSSSSNDFVQMMALTGSSGVAIHPFAPG